MIAAARSADSYVAGALPINRRRGGRISKDIDIFHDREADAAAAAEKDADLLRRAGFTVNWLRRLPGIHVLHPVDLAVNKLVAAANRREPRDVVDLVNLHKNYLSLGAIALAAAGVVGGFTPEGLLEEVSRNSRYVQEDFRGLSAEQPIDADMVLRNLRVAIEQARAFVARMPTEEVGTIFLKDGVPVEPDPQMLDGYVRHKPQRKGHWPTTQEITSSMLERLQNLGKV